MKELKDNEKRAYEKLLKMAEKKNPVEVSLRTFDLTLRKKKWFFNWVYRKASHIGVKGIFENLQKKGYITLDRSDRSNPKVKVIINR